ncbi:hypothetical protein TWF481_009747 [Arthrobotrys musiformis]|uniref:F-box domain-containing protein n=1 Tax=Arthrobotrys musiformis TaxID=47236 RepID=A0AAV9W794_9PEZI
MESSPAPDAPKDLLELPLEICGTVLSFLGKEDKTAFSRASRKCYFISFPSRFRGINLSEEGGRILLEQFENGWLQPARTCVRSVTFKYHNIKKFASILPTVKVFPNFNRLAIQLTGTDGIERNLYFSTIKLLSTLPSCDKIEYLSLNWARFPSRPRESIFQSAPETIEKHTGDESELPSNLSTCARYAAPVVKNLDDSPKLPYACEEERAYAQVFARLREKEQEFLGPFLSNENLTGELEALPFPPNLRTFEIDIADAQTYHFLSFFNTKADVHLSLKDTMKPIKTPTQPSVDVHLPTVKKVSISFDLGDVDTRLSEFLKPFSNLESLTITHRNDEVPQNTWSTVIPNFQRLREIALPWPLSRDRPTRNVNTIGQDIKERLNAGEFPSLRTIKLFKPRQLRGNVVGTVSKAGASADGTQDWNFNWTDDSFYHQDLRSDGVLPSGPTDPESFQFQIISSF